jgi:hypothetical protein
MVINICYRGQRGGLGFYRGLHGPMPWKKLHDGNVLAEKKMHDGTIQRAHQITINKNSFFQCATFLQYSISTKDIHQIKNYKSKLVVSLPSINIM